MKHRFLLYFLLFYVFSISVSDADLVTIENSWLSVSVDPVGAELQSIRHINTDTEYLWQGDPEYWENRAPVMFPVNVRFKDNRFSIEVKAMRCPDGFGGNFRVRDLSLGRW